MDNNSIIVSSPSPITIKSALEVAKQNSGIAETCSPPRIIFLSRFLNNLSLSDKEKNYILDNTLARVQVIDTVRGNDMFCTGKISEDLE